VTDDDIYPLLRTSEDFIDTVKHRDMTLEELEREYIRYLLKKYRNKTRVARILGIARKSLYNKLSSYEAEKKT